MARKVTRFSVMAGENFGKRRYELREFKTRAKAKAFVKKLNAPGKVNPGGVRQTSFRNAQSGVGIKNPRIRKKRVFR